MPNFHTFAQTLFLHLEKMTEVEKKYMDFYTPSARHAILFLAG